jgi:hypothetical protein
MARRRWIIAPSLEVGFHSKKGRSQAADWKIAVNRVIANGKPDNFVF